MQAAARPEPPDRPQAPGDAGRGVYSISVAAELAGSTAQNLRLYEARGLLTPARTDGGTRRYSAEDVDRLREITRLLGDGLNLAGVQMVLKLRHDNRQLAEDNTRLVGDNTRLRTDNRALRRRHPSTGEADALPRPARQTFTGSRRRRSG